MPRKLPGEEKASAAGKGRALTETASAVINRERRALIDRAIPNGAVKNGGQGASIATRGKNTRTRRRRSGGDSSSRFAAAGRKSSVARRHQAMISHRRTAIR